MIRGNLVQAFVEAFRGVRCQPRGGNKQQQAANYEKGNITVETRDTK